MTPHEHRAADIIQRGPIASQVVVVTALPVRIVGEIEHGCLIDFGSFSGLAQLVDDPVLPGSLELFIDAPFAEPRGPDKQFNRCLSGFAGAKPKLLTLPFGRSLGWGEARHVQWLYTALPGRESRIPRIILGIGIDTDKTIADNGLVRFSTQHGD